MTEQESEAFFQSLAAACARRIEACGGRAADEYIASLSAAEYEAHRRKMKAISHRINRKLDADFNSRGQ